MLTRPQQILLKRAQRQAGLSDEEYRDALETVASCRSSKDSRMTDRHLDIVLAFIEACFWRSVDIGELQPPCRPDAVFQRRGYWAAKNTRQETSRDRFTNSNLGQDIASLERELAALGFGVEYCATIRRNVTKGRSDAHALHLYRAALGRTLRAKQRSHQPHEQAA